MPERNYLSHVLKSFRFVLIFSSLAYLLGYGIRLVYSTYLSQNEFGLFYSVLAVVALIEIFRDLGLNKALVKFIPSFLVKNDREKVKSSIVHVLLFQFIASLIFIVVLFVLADYLSVSYFKDKGAIPVLLILGIAFLFSLFVNIFKLIFQGFQKFHYLSVINFLNIFLIFIFSIVLLGRGFGVIGSAFAYLLAPLVVFFISFFFFKKTFPDFFRYKFCFDKNLSKELFKYGLPIMFAGTGALVVLGRTDTMFLTYFSGLKHVAFYNVAFPTAKLMTFLVSILGMIYLPLFSELFSRKDYRRIKIGMGYTYKYLFIVMIALVISLIVFSDQIIYFLFGTDYIYSSILLKILAPGALFFSFAILNFSFLNAAGSTKDVALAVYVAAILNIILNFLLVPIYNSVGASITTSFSYLMMFIVTFAKLNKILALRLPIKDLSRTFFIGLISFLLLILIIDYIWPFDSLISYFALFLLFILFYFLLLLMFGVINFFEIKLFLKGFFR
jgi:O-antigen/teichoic acid export membrane protein